MAPAMERVRTMRAKNTMPKPKAAQMLRIRSLSVMKRSTKPRANLPSSKG